MESSLLRLGLGTTGVASLSLSGGDFCLTGVPAPSPPLAGLGVLCATPTGVRGVLEVGVVGTGDPFKCLSIPFPFPEDPFPFPEDPFPFLGVVAGASAGLSTAWVGGACATPPPPATGLVRGEDTTPPLGTSFPGKGGGWAGVMTVLFLPEKKLERRAMSAL